MRKLAGLMVMLAACGDDSPVRHLDGGTDSPTQIDGSMVQPVTLTVTINGTGAPGVKVYFQGVDSSLISNTLTDSAGVATAVMPNGGFVTALDPYAEDNGIQLETHELYTFSGVKPGDHLVLKTGFSSGTLATITAPIDSTAGVTGYVLSSPCGRSFVGADGSGAQPSWTLELGGACATTTDFIVASTDDGGQAINWFYVPNKAVAATIDLTAGTYVAATGKTYSYTNANSFYFVDFEQSFVSGKGTVITQASTAFGKGSPYTGFLATTPFTGAVDMVHGFASMGTDTEHHFLDWGPFSATYTTDVGARMLPELSAPTIDPAAHALTWTETTPGVAPDFTIAFLQAGRERVSPMPTLVWAWYIVAPYNSGSLSFPTLPTDVADFTIGASDFYDIEGVSLAKVPGGYDAVRANLLSSTGPETLVTSATGSITAATWMRPTKSRAVPQHRSHVPGAVTGIMRDRAVPTHRGK